MTRVFHHPIAKLAASNTSTLPSGRRFYSRFALREIIKALLRLENTDERYFAKESLVALAADLGHIQGEWKAANALIELVRRSCADACLHE
jgi:hypothetical protein